MPTDGNLYDMVKKAEREGVDMGKDEAKPEPKDSALRELREDLKEMVEVDSLQTLLDRHRQPPPAAVPPPVGVKMELDLGEIFKAQQAAATAANEAANQANRDYWGAQQDRLKDMYDRLQEAMKPQPPQGGPQPSAFDIYRGVSAELRALQGELGLGAGIPMQTGMDTSTLITLKKMEMQQQQWIEESRQAAEDRQMDWKLKFLEHEAKMNEYRDKQQRGQNIWGNLLGGLSHSVQQGAREGLNARQSMGQTPGGVEVLQCPTEGCGSPIPVAPGAKQATCSQCKVVYDIEVTE